MIILAGRVLAATVAAVVVAATWFMTVNSGSDTVTLAQVLEKVEKADSLHLKLALDDKQAQAVEAWAGRGQSLRVNRADGTYEIACGERLWKIDEKANRAASGPSPYYQVESKSLDLLPLLDAKGDISPKMHQNLRTVAVRPVHEKIGDVEYDIYRFETADGGKTLYLEARVNAATKLLHSLETLVDRDGRRTPVATLTVLNMNQPVDEDLFVVGDVLTEDGRIGKVIDVQGVVAVKPVMVERWTPVCGNILLKPGDWLQTDPRGANAVAARLAGKLQITAGPNTLVELSTPKQLRLFSGDLKIAVEPKASVMLLGPGEEKLEVKESGVYRVEKEKMVRLEQEPKWLMGFEGSEVQESLGSLVANVDGRNESLTVGYHKVSVEILDQIARTTVEESFANHTGNRLEGVFYFPLPQDASISGFGMWICNELVEADIVEKQRAREIYEEILREKRDPGLLEWSGGNLFKARVFPIEPNAEKRIRIVYTQVLPLTGNKFRYSYALQSEMLKRHPLRELSIDVKLNSVVPLKNVASPTHTVRIDLTEHAAHVEFAAKDYTPNRDFEVVTELDGKQSEITLIPHRRGDDGYFMLMLAPPAAEMQDDRNLLVGKEPLNVLFLADTSVSFDEGQRAKQSEFIAAVLKSLTPRDTFNMACMDVETDWVFEKAVSADAKNIEVARQFLERRVSLGWTDLEKAFSSVFDRAGEKAIVIYIGDGIPTVGDGEPAAVSNRITKMYDGKYRGKHLVCHAISVGSTFESGVLKAIASLGSGSMRQISGEQGPRGVALDLLKEITRPALSNLKAQFDGLRVARVYPEQLPNLPAGSQQILLGRYLPQGGEQSGTITINGMRGEREVKFEKKVSMKNAEEGNSFIPRLWARMHLDSLLQQGTMTANKDDIIALSEEYHIITPYTSLLVLESDADRERFKVKRSFQMRDGEKFFAEGRDNANFELIQQQMKRGGSWRMELRKSVLQQLSGLGRDANVIPQERVYAVADLVVPVPQFVPVPTGANASYANAMRCMEIGKGGSSDKGGEDFDSLIDLITKTVQPDSWEDDSEKLGQPGHLMYSLRGSGSIKPFETNLSIVVSQTQEKYPTFSTTSDEVQESDIPGLGCSTVRGYQTLGRAYNRQRCSTWDVPACEPCYTICKPVYETHTREIGYTVCNPQWKKACVFARRQREESILGTLFGELPPATTVKKTPVSESDWPEEAHVISRNLLHTVQFALPEGGLQIDSETDEFDPRFGNLTHKSNTKFLSNAKSWLVYDAADGEQTIVEWCDGNERGIFNLSFQLGRIRKAHEQELKTPFVGADSFLTDSLEDTFRNQKVSVEHTTEGEALLTFIDPSNAKSKSLMRIDTQRNVVLSIEGLHDGKTTSTQKYDDFVEVAGAWWAGKIETRDEKGRVTSLTKQKFVRLDDEKYALSMNHELAGRERIQFLRDPARKVIEAKKALKAGKADFDDQITLLAHFAKSQQWTRVMEHLVAAEKLAAGHPGIRWLRYVILKSSRRNEELKNLFLKEAAALAGSPVRAAAEDRPGEEAKDVKHDHLFLASHLLDQSSVALEANEMLALLDVLKPVYACQPEYQLTMTQWMQQRARYLSACDRGDEAFDLYREIAEANPHDLSIQRQYTTILQNCLEFDASRKWIDRVLSNGTPWEIYEIDQFRDAYANSLSCQNRYQELIAYLKPWIEENPEKHDPYYQYLDAILYVDRVEDAYALAKKWFQEGRRSDFNPAVAARMEAAVRWILSGDNWSGHGTDYNMKFWQEQLIETAVFFARHETQFSISSWILDNWEFRQSEANRPTRERLAKILAEKFDRMNSVEIKRFVEWLRGEDQIVEKPTWKNYARRLQLRYASEQDAEQKYQLVEAARIIMLFCTEPEEYLAFLRQAAAEVPEKYRPEFIEFRFDKLLDQPWSEKSENEAFDLLDKLHSDETPEQQIIERARALHHLTDGMLKARLEAKSKAIEHLEKLTRTELAAKIIENMRNTREEYANRLAREEAKHTGPLLRWFTAEQLYLDVQLDRNLEKAAEICWKVLDAKLPRIDTTSDEAACLRAEMDWALRNRYLVTIMNLAARKNAPSGLIRRLSDYLDHNIARELAEQTENQQWKLLKYELLIALDRPQELEKSLEEWIHAGDADNRWRTALGYVLAEQGKLTEAIAIFTKVAANDDLGSDENQALSDWYQAVGRRDDYEKAIMQKFKTMAQWELDRWLDSQIEPWINNQGQSPSALEPEVMWAFQALFEKTNVPANYIDDRFLPLYRACRDFRLLACLADSISGQAAEQIYPYLKSIRSVIDDIHEEAAVDSLSARIKEHRERAATDVDRRALDLLEAMTERHAAELRNQSAAHVEKSLAALRQAFKREWMPGEEKLMADYLADLGVIPQEKLAAEQMRQLEEFYRISTQGTQLRLDMARARAKALWNYNQRQKALDLLLAEINQFSIDHAERAGGRGGEHGYFKPLCEQSIFIDYVSYLGQMGHYTDAVQLLQKQIMPEMKAQKVCDLKIRIIETYQDALHHQGQINGLQGEKLYRVLQEDILAKLSSGDASFDSRLIILLNSVYLEAHNQKISVVNGDLKAFAFGKSQELLRHQVREHENLVHDLCEKVRQICGPAEGIAFLLDSFDHQPRWMRNRQNFWNSHGNRLTEWRKEADQLDAKLSERLLQFVLAVLRDRLLDDPSDNMPICQTTCPAVFWTEREADFLRTAEEVYAKNSNSSQIVGNVADYLASGLGRYNRTIEILQAAQTAKVLDEGGQFKLVDYLHRQNRFGESIVLAKSLVESYPDNIAYRAMLIAAFFHTNRKAELFNFLQITEDYLHKHDRWNEESLAGLAESCMQSNSQEGELQQGIHSQALKYYGELIPLHKQNHPRQGVADAQLSQYYFNRARCYAELKKTPEAVEDAFSAVVCWGPDFKNRAKALDMLRYVIQRCDDLDAYVKTIDEQITKTRLDNPLIRKILGQVYSERGQYDKAVAQLRLACELQPNDTDIHQGLVDCCDKQNDRQGAIRQLLASVQMSRRDINLYKELGRRLAELHEERESERSYTSIVEVLASESESHAMLAEIRESQNRWSEAAGEWRQVVRLRALEPTGLLRLAAVQIHEKQWAAAAETAKLLRSKPWPPRFENIEKQILELEERVKMDKKGNISRP